jgi:hypothetical protein
MLAALRVLHLDSSHAQAVLAAIEEHPTLMTYQLAPDFAHEVRWVSVCAVDRC